MKFTDCLPRKPELRDYKSPEKSIINETFISLPYMDMWISSIIEGYIYEKVDKVDKKGYREEYTERYGELEGEYKKWRRGADGKSNGQLEVQCYYKKGKLEGELKIWYSTNGQLYSQRYYKEGKKEGEYKSWYFTGKLAIHCYYKEGKLEGEYKGWDFQGILNKHYLYKNNEIVQTLLS